MGCPVMVFMPLVRYVYLFSAEKPLLVESMSMDNRGWKLPVMRHLVSLYDISLALVYQPKTMYEYNLVYFPGYCVVDILLAINWICPALGLFVSII
jgi:hypothetical protein